MDKLNRAAGDKIDVIFVCGTDFGTQISTFCSADTFRDLYMPYYKKINNWIHENTNWKTFKHSCGAIEPFIPLLIESGFDILNPVQCSATGMDPQTLKDKYGKDVVFWGGGIDTQKLLPFGTPAEVKEQVKERCHIFGRDGGVTFSGGEPLMQHGFLRKTADLLKSEGIHLAVETSSFAQHEIYRETIALFDYVMADLKLFECGMHETYTGVKNDRILDNLRWLMHSGKEFVIRVPLIPGITDTEANLTAIADFVEDSPVELLSYNNMAGAKYESVGRKFGMDPLEKQAKDELAEMAALFRNARVR